MSIMVPDLVFRLIIDALSDMDLVCNLCKRRVCEELCKRRRDVICMSDGQVLSESHIGDSNHHLS